MMAKITTCVDANRKIDGLHMVHNRDYMTTYATTIETFDVPYYCHSFIVSLLD